MRTKFLLVAALASLLLGNAAIASEPTPAYSPAHIDYPGSQVVYHIAETFPHLKSDLGYGAIPRSSSTDNGGTDGGRQVGCTGMADPDCDPETQNFPSPLSGQVLLPACQNEKSENCVSEIWISDSMGKLVKAKFLREIGGYTIPGDSKRDFVEGRSASIWTVEGVPHTGGVDTYLVAPRLELEYKALQKKFVQQKITVSVIPFVAKKGEYTSDRWLTPEEWQNRITREPQWIGYEPRFIPKILQGGPKPGADRDKSCFFYDENICGIQYDFIPDTRIKFSVRTSNQLGGWFRGRIENPVINVEKISNTMNLLTIEGTSMKVPRMVHLVPWHSFTGQEEKDFIKYFWGGALPGDLLAGPNSDSGDRVFEFVNSFRDRVKDTVSGYTTMWNFSTVSAGGGSSCLTDTTKVLGVVTTNSMGYEGSAPGFVDGSLDYRVAGLHFAPDGKTEVKGTYDLIMRSETARCLYGFTNAPISATISVTSDSGENSIATTQVSEENGWLKLGAYNFTFSNPTVKVKLAQAKAASPVVAQKKKSITCVKGKIVKKVAGVNPKCPTGFRKR